MRALLWVILLVAAGCISPADLLDGGSGAPVLVAPEAKLSVVGDTAFASWSGMLRPVARLPADNPLVAPPADPTQPDEHSADHGFTMPAGVTFLRGWLNTSVEGAVMTLLILNDTSRRMCGTQFDLESPVECFATFYRPLAHEEEWKARVTLEGIDGAPADVHYNLTLAFTARELPILGSPVPWGASAPLQFGDPVLVDADRHTGEPSIALTPDGTIYIAAPTGAQEALWRSTDGGLTFTFVPIHGARGDPGAAYPIGGGDSDVVVAGDNTIYFADQQGGSGETVSASHDGGATWMTTPLAAGPPAVPGAGSLPLPVPVPIGLPGVPTGAAYAADRQWLVTDGEQTVWMGFNSNQGATVVKSIDGGRTFPVRVFVDGDNCFRGNLARSPDGTLYLAGCNENGPGVGVSTDGGMSFTYKQVAQRDGETDTSFLFAAHIFVVATTDAANNVYIIWSDEAQEPGDTGAPATGARGLNVWLASSSDQGATWSAPKKVNSMNGTFVQPWATGGAAGQVAVAYYGTKFEGNPERVMGEWYPILAQTDDALAAAPVWREAAISQEFVQYGPVCMRGSACGGARNLLDFFQIQADKDGMIHVAYVDGRNGISARFSNIMYAGQTGGPGVGGPSVDKNAP